MSRSPTNLRQKLTLIILMVSVIAVFVATVAITLLGYNTLRDNMRTEQMATTAILGAQSRSVLQFKDPISAQQNLNALSTSLNVRQACLYAQDGSVFAHYQRSDINKKCPAGGTVTKGAYYVKGALITVDDILPASIFNAPFQSSSNTNNENPIGQIYIETDLRDLEAFLTQQLIISAVVMLFTILMSYVLARALQRNISHPILQLSEVAKKVSLSKDYSLRVSTSAEQRVPEEILTLIQSFNTMLIEIEDRDKRLRRKNEELARAKESAEGANLSKSQFLANISHELRTPLNAIIGFSSIIMNQLFGKINENKYLEYATDIHESGIHLLDIINDILDLSKAEAGKLTLEIEAFSIEKALQKCMNILSERAKEGNVIMHMHVPDDVPMMVADRVRFIQIILNIVSNAVKFTHPGGRVDMHVSVTPANNDIYYFNIEIVDTGIGMEAEDIRKAFTSFGQVDSGLNRKYEGTGLGLPLTKKLVELHNATIEIESEVGKGTKVSLRFISDPNVIK